ncbi:MAG TPA: MucR family transcriptional regulator [Magnetospirillum sp.]|nr:MucR family transcriptional regulator [Magnetospirillum sp.]
MPIKLASKIVTAYLQANPLPVSEIPSLISSVAIALERASAPVETAPELSPAVAVKKSVRPDAIICLECRAEQRTLKRHLQTAHDLSPEEYRARWGLGADYPMVAPDYAAKRSQLAKDAGLGRKPKTVADAIEAPTGKPGFRYPASRWAKPAK